MTDTKEKTTLADIVKSQDANSEEVKQNDISLGKLNNIP